MEHGTSLIELIGEKVLGVAACYQPDGVNMDVYICGVDIRCNNELSLQFARGHSLKKDQLLTVHLDNRTGVSEYDAELSVYRLSYKAKVISVSEHFVEVCPIEYSVFYGIQVILQYQAQDYQFPIDNRVAAPLPLTPLEQLAAIDDNEHDNKVGVLVTYAEGQPHTTVMAFLSSIDDDIFFITFPNTFKSKLLKRNNQCYFAIDNRATFTFEEAIEWNYSIIKGEAFQIPNGTEQFEMVREQFIAKNPWEVGFFSAPEIEMYHIKPSKVVCPGSKKATCWTV